MGTVELDIGVNKKMCIFYFQKYESHHILVIIKHYTIIANFKNICVGLLYFDRNINILYISLKILLFTTKRTFKF